MEDSPKRYLPAETWMDWRETEGGDPHFKRFEFLFETMLWTDVTFIVGTDRTEFLAHKLILRTGSIVFDNIFNKNPTTPSFEIRDVNPIEFEILLRVRLHTYINIYMMELKDEKDIDVEKHQYLY